jgi:hypothetical protein
MAPNPLPFRIQQQECTEWCWASVVSSVAVFVNSAQQPAQCEVVDREAFSPNDPSPGCCQARNSCNGGGTNNVCNRTGSIGLALQDYGLSQNPGAHVPSPADFATITQQIDLCCVVVFELVDRVHPQVAHVMVVTGYSGTDTLSLLDPAVAGAHYSYSYSELLDPVTAEGDLSGWRLNAFYMTVPGQC